jgi:hypothetical protein
MESLASETTFNHSIDLSQLQNFAIREAENGFVVALTDDEGFESVRGFGNTPTEAINDLHSNLI